VAVSCILFYQMKLIAEHKGQSFILHGYSYHKIHSCLVTFHGDVFIRFHQYQSRNMGNTVRNVFTLLDQASMTIIESVFTELMLA
jgi:hypothetical protein